MRISNQDEPLPFKVTILICCIQCLVEPLIKQILLSGNGMPHLDLGYTV